MTYFLGMNKEQHDSAIVEAEKTYSSVYTLIDAALPASEFFGDDADIEEACVELNSQVREQRFIAASGMPKPVFSWSDSEEDEQYGDAWYEEFTCWEEETEHNDTIKVDHDTMIIPLMNYKGEGEGFDLLSNASKYKNFKNSYRYRPSDWS